MDPSIKDNPGAIKTATMLRIERFRKNLYEDSLGLGKIFFMFDLSSVLASMSWGGSIQAACWLVAPTIKRFEHDTGNFAENQLSILTCQLFLSN